MAPQTMKEVHVSEDLQTKLYDSPIPEVPEGHLLIKIEVASSNPKDWKIPTLLNSHIPKELHRTPDNSGDDMAGTIVALGSNLKGNWHIGDRVAGFHVMVTVGGAYAEYGVIPEWTTLYLGTDPDQGGNGLRYEEAVTCTLAMYTAAVGLYQVFNYRAPWERKTENDPRAGPIVIWGGSTAVGAFAIKFLKASGAGPIITTVGKSRDFVAGLLDESKGDVIVDYRQEDAVGQIKKIIKERGLKIDKVFDCVSEGDCQILAGSIFEKEDNGHLAIVLPPDSRIPEGQKFTQVSVGSVHPQMGLDGWGGFKPGAQEDKEFARCLSTWVQTALKEGRFKGHPTRVIPGGLNGVGEGLRQLKEGKVNAEKLVYIIKDTFQ
ncbi:zinc-binding oxidoreductase-like protein ToxD [Ascobolus immersus RN42]|uniref:Zinc-binding oxidoreductase-like protein ToxD n=1 Tax=Ascobolus immersus RN42 TaxID=1160509 RepID=A0A3N4I0N8_ASCIM|nr:zinc-binding oxidoreductase-like protein ToxD [Ascobolus immersus RN42]